MHGTLCDIYTRELYEPFSFDLSLDFSLGTTFLKKIEHSHTTQGIFQIGFAISEDLAKTSL